MTALITAKSHLRYLRSLIPLGNKDESFNFARFRDSDTTELSNLPNGSVAKSYGASSGESPGGGDRGGKLSPGADGDCAGIDNQELEQGDNDGPRSNRNRITALQAGWNVTNAIQVHDN